MRLIVMRRFVSSNLVDVRTIAYEASCRVSNCFLYSEKLIRQVGIGLGGIGVERSTSTVDAELTQVWKWLGYPERQEGC